MSARFSLGVAPSALRKGGFLIFLLGIGSSGVIAQEFRALISGVVKDPSGSAIPGAKVSVRNVATNLAVNYTTGVDGGYFISQLPVGNYQLNVEANGFKKYTRDGITLSVGDKAIADVAMQLGSNTESVTVSAELTGIESDQSVLGQTLGSKQMVDIAFGGRNFLNFMEFSAGVLGQESISQSATNAGENNNGRDMNYEFHGGRPNAMLWTMDGASNGLQGGASFIPLEDSIAEMKVSAPISDASYGLSGGGVISVTTKSGTNQLHGVLNEFFQNNVLDAWTTQQKAAQAQNPALKYRKKRDNVYSGLLSGPVIKNKLFFSTSYDGRQTAAASSTNTSVPTMLQRGGDFSQTFNSAGQLDVIYDPLTTRQVGTAFVRDAFPGNLIPSNRMNPVAKNILALDVQPNYVSPNSPITNVNNYFIGNNPNTVSFQGLWDKGDYIWSPKNRTSATWDRSARTGFSATGNGILRPNPLLTVNGDPIKRQHQGSIVDHVAMLNATTVLTVRAAWDFWTEKVYGRTQWGYDGTKLGFTGPTGLQGIGFPQFGFSGGPVAFAGFGNSQYDIRPKTDYELSGDLSKSMGKHFLRVGARAAQIREGYQIRGNFLGSLTVDAGFTQANPQQSDATSGNSMASFLLGYPSGGNVANNALLTFYMNQVSLYFQDDFRVTPKLMVNYGVRWDVQTPARERFNRMDVGFDPNSTYQLGGTTAKGSLMFADGPNSKTNTPFDTHYRDIQPRFGVAYQVTPKLIFRGGAGMSYLPMDAYRSGTGIEDAGLTAGYSVNTQYLATTGGGASLYIPGLPGTSTLANPFPTGFLQPLGSALGSSALVGTGLTVRDRDYKIPYVLLFQAGFDYELPWRTTLEASYVGSRTHRIAISQNIDYIPLDQRLLGVATPSYLTQAVPNPFFGASQLTGTSLASATITRNQSLMPFPQFTGVTQTAVPVGHSWYNSLEMRLNKRFSHGLSVLLVYTFAKAMEATSYLEPQYTFLDRELSGWDRTHNLDIAGSYELPIGKGKQFLTHMGPVLDRIIGNWQANTAITYLNGTPLGMPGAIPARDPRLRGSDQSLTHYFDTCTLLTNGTRSNCIGNEPVTWIQLAPNQLRTYSLLSPNMRTPTVPRTNISLFKIIPIHERLKLEFRASAFNAFNNKIYGSPSTSLTGATFGQVTLGSQSNGARVGEFALRLMW
jgi:hypothetical protein